MAKLDWRKAMFDKKMRNQGAGSPPQPRIADIISVFGYSPPEPARSHVQPECGPDAPTEPTKRRRFEKALATEWHRLNSDPEWRAKRASAAHKRKQDMPRAPKNRPSK